MRISLIFLSALLLMPACKKEEDPFVRICEACSQKKSVAVSDSASLYLPAFISPNSDGINDVFHPRVETVNGSRELNEFFTSVSFSLIDPSGKQRVLLLEDSEIIFDGSAGDGKYLGDGVYTYELNLDGNIHTRYLGVFIHPFCLSSMNCEDSCGLSLQYDPIFSTGCD